MNAWAIDLRIPIRCSSFFKNSPPPSEVIAPPSNILTSRASASLAHHSDGTSEYVLLTDDDDVPVFSSSTCHVAFSPDVIRIATKFWGRMDARLRTLQTGGSVSVKRRDLLNDTLILWGGEFGRTPCSDSGAGRDQNDKGYTM